MEEIVLVRPRIAPAGWGDGLRTLAVVAAAVCAVAGLCRLASGLLTSGPAPRTWPLLVVPVLVLALSVVLMLTRVGWLKLSAEGMRFGSWLEQRKPVPWSDIRSVRPASSAEVIVRGWLWPPVPPREATPTFSSVGHYRIETRRGVRYFPPLAEGEFVEAVARWAPHAISDPSTAWAAPRGA
jgi:hypothetical protein